MANLKLPHDLVGMFKFLTGMEWPEMNTDSMYALAEVYKETAAEIRDQVPGLLDEAVQILTTTFQIEATDPFVQAMVQYTSAQPSYIEQLASAADELSTFIRDTSAEAEYTKYMIIACITQLLVEIAIAIAHAWFTFGASLSVIPGLIAAARAVLSRLFSGLLRAMIAHAILGALTMLAMDQIIQRIQIAQGHRDKIDGGLALQAIEMGAISGGLGPVIGKFGGFLGERLGNLVGRDLGKTLDRALTGAFKDVFGKDVPSGLGRDLSRLVAGNLGGFRKGFTDAGVHRLGSGAGEVFGVDLAGRLGADAARDLGDRYGSALARGWGTETLGRDLSRVLRGEGAGLTDREVRTLARDVPRAISDVLAQAANDRTFAQTRYWLGNQVGHLGGMFAHGMLSEATFNLIFGEDHTFTAHLISGVSSASGGVSKAAHGGVESTSHLRLPELGDVFGGKHLSLPRLGDLFGGGHPSEPHLSEPHLGDVAVGDHLPSLDHLVPAPDHIPLGDPRTGTWQAFQHELNQAYATHLDHQDRVRVASEQVDSHIDEAFTQWLSSRTGGTASALGDALGVRRGQLDGPRIEQIRADARRDILADLRDASIERSGPADPAWQRTVEEQLATLLDRFDQHALATAGDLHVDRLVDEKFAEWARRTTGGPDAVLPPEALPAIHQEVSSAFHQWAADATHTPAGPGTRPDDLAQRARELRANLDVMGDRLPQQFDYTAGRHMADAQAYQDFQDVAGDRPRTTGGTGGDPVTGPLADFHEAATQRLQDTFVGQVDQAYRDAFGGADIFRPGHADGGPPPLDQPAATQRWQADLAKLRDQLPGWLTTGADWQRPITRDWSALSSASDTWRAGAAASDPARYQRFGLADAPLSDAARARAQQRFFGELGDGFQDSYPAGPLARADHPAAQAWAQHVASVTARLPEIIATEVARDAARADAGTAFDAAVARQRGGLPEAGVQRVRDGFLRRVDDAYTRRFVSDQPAPTRVAGFDRDVARLLDGLPHDIAVERAAESALRQAAALFDEVATGHQMSGGVRADLGEQYRDDLLAGYRETWSPAGPDPVGGPPLPATARPRTVSDPALPGSAPAAAPDRAFASTVNTTAGGPEHTPPRAGGAATPPRPAAATPPRPAGRDVAGASGPGGERQDRPGAPVDDERAWRHNTADDAPWFGVPEHPLHAEQWAGARDRAPYRTVHTEAVDVRRDSSPQWIDQDRGIIRYDLRRMEVEPGRWVQEYTVKLHLRPAPGTSGGDLARVRRDTGDAVDRLFNRGNRLPSGDQFHARVEFVDDPAQAHAVVTVSPAGETYQTRWAADAPDTVFAHEVGHFLGLGDEGTDGRVFHRENPAMPTDLATGQPHRPANSWVPDDGLMGDAGGSLAASLKPRHLWRIERTAGDQVAVPATSHAQLFGDEPVHPGLWQHAPLDGQAEPPLGRPAPSGADASGPGSEPARPATGPDPSVPPRLAPANRPRTMADAPPPADPSGTPLSHMDTSPARGGHADAPPAQDGHTSTQPHPAAPGMQPHPAAPGTGQEPASHGTEQSPSAAPRRVRFVEPHPLRLVKSVASWRPPRLEVVEGAHLMRTSAPDVNAVGDRVRRLAEAGTDLSGLPESDRRPLSLAAAEAWVSSGPEHPQTHQPMGRAEAWGYLRRLENGAGLVHGTYREGAPQGAPRPVGEAATAAFDRRPWLDTSAPKPGPQEPVRFADGSRMPKVPDRVLRSGYLSLALADQVSARIADAYHLPGSARAELSEALGSRPGDFTGDGGRLYYRDGAVHHELTVTLRGYGNWDRYADSTSTDSSLTWNGNDNVGSARSEGRGDPVSLGISLPISGTVAPAGFGEIGVRLGRERGVGYSFSGSIETTSSVINEGGSHVHVDDALIQVTYRDSRGGQRPPLSFSVHNGIWLRIPDAVTTPSTAPHRFPLDISFPEGGERPRAIGVGPVELRRTALDDALHAALKQPSIATHGYADAQRFLTGSNVRQHLLAMMDGWVPMPGTRLQAHAVPSAGHLAEVDAKTKVSAGGTVGEGSSRALSGTRSLDLTALAGGVFKGGVAKLKLGLGGKLSFASTHTVNSGGGVSAGQGAELSGPVGVYDTSFDLHLRDGAAGPHTVLADQHVTLHLGASDARRLAGWSSGNRGPEEVTEPQPPANLTADHPTGLASTTDMLGIEPLHSGADEPAARHAGTPGQPASPQPAGGESARPARAGTDVIGDFARRTIDALRSRHPDLIADPATGHGSARAKRNLDRLNQQLSYEALSRRLDRASGSAGVRIDLETGHGFRERHTAVVVHAELTDRVFEGTRVGRNARLNLSGTTQLDGSHSLSHGIEFGPEFSVASTNLAPVTLDGGARAKIGWQWVRRTGYGPSISHSVSVPAQGSSHEWSYQLDLSAELRTVSQARHWLRGGLPGAGLLAGRLNGQAHGESLVPRDEPTSGRIHLLTPAALAAPSAPPVRHQPRVDAILPDSEPARALRDGIPAPDPHGPDALDGRPYEVLSVPDADEVAHQAHQVLGKVTGRATPFETPGDPVHDTVDEELSPLRMAADEPQYISGGKLIPGLLGKGLVTDRQAILVVQSHLDRNTMHVVSEPSRDLPLKRETKVSVTLDGETTRKKNVSSTVSTGVTVARDKYQGVDLKGKPATKYGGGVGAGASATYGFNWAHGTNSTMTVSLARAEQFSGHTVTVNASATHQVQALGRRTGRIPELIRAPGELLSWLRGHPGQAGPLLPGPDYAGRTVHSDSGVLLRLTARDARELSLLPEHPVDASDTHRQPRYDDWHLPDWYRQGDALSFVDRGVDGRAQLRDLLGEMARQGLRHLSSIDPIRDQGSLSRIITALSEPVDQGLADAMARHEVSFRVDNSGLVRLRQGRVVVELSQAEDGTRFAGLDHDVALSESLGATRESSTSRSRTHGLSYGVDLRGSEAPHENGAFHEGREVLSGAGGVDRTTSGKQTQTRSRSTDMSVAGPTARFTGRVHLSVYLEEGDRRTHIGGVDSAVTERVPLSDAIPHTSPELAPHGAAPGDGPTVRLPQHAVPGHPDRTPVSDLMSRWRDDPDALTLPANAFPAHIGDLPVLHDAARKAVWAAAQDANGRDRLAHGTESRLEWPALLGPGQPSAEALQHAVGEPVLRANLVDLADPAGAAKPPYTVTLHENSGAAGHDVNLATFVKLQRTGARLLTVDDNRTLATSGDVLGDVGDIGADGGRSGTTSAKSERGVSRGDSGGASGSAAPATWTPKQDADFGQNMNSGTTDRGTAGMSDSQSGGQSAGFSTESGRAMLFRIPATWRHVAQADRRYANALRGTLPPVLTEVSGTTVDVWLTERQARALGLIDDRAFPHELSDAWDQVKQAGDRWKDEAARYDDARVRLDRVERERGEARESLNAREQAIERVDREYATRWGERNVLAARADRSLAAVHEAERAADEARRAHEAALAGPSTADGTGGPAGQAHFGADAAARVREAETAHQAARERLDLARAEHRAVEDAARTAAEELSRANRNRFVAHAARHVAGQHAQSREDAVAAAVRELGDAHAAAERTGAELAAARRAADALTAWYQRPDGDRPAAWAPEPEPDLGVPGPPQYIAGESGGRHLVGPDGQRYDIVGDWPARDSFFHALDDAAGRAGHPIAADPAGANGLRQQIADQIRASSVLGDFSAPDRDERFTDDELRAARLELDAPAQREFADTHLIPDATPLDRSRAQALAAESLLRGVANENGATGGDLAPAAAARTLGQPIRVIRADGGFQDFHPEGGMHPGDPAIVLHVDNGLYHTVVLHSGQQSAPARSWTVAPDRVTAPDGRTAYQLGTPDTFIGTLAEGIRAADPDLFAHLARTGQDGREHAAGTGEAPVEPMPPDEFVERTGNLVGYLAGPESDWIVTAAARTGMAITVVRPDGTTLHAGPRTGGRIVLYRVGPDGYRLGTRMPVPQQPPKPAPHEPTSPEVIPAEATLPRAIPPGEPQPEPAPPGMAPAGPATESLRDLIVRALAGLPVAKQVSPMPAPGRQQ